MVSLTMYRGIQVLDEVPNGYGGRAIQGDLKSLVEWSPKSEWDESNAPDEEKDETLDYYRGSMWLRTSTTLPQLFLCHDSTEDDAKWVQLALQVSSVVSKTSAYSIAETDDVVLCNATGGAFDVTLPDAADFKGRRFTIKRLNSGSHAVTVAAASGQTIDGASTSVLGTQYLAITVVSDGSNWFVI
jgi:hypothetical protein